MALMTVYEGEQPKTPQKKAVDEALLKQVVAMQPQEEIKQFISEKIDEYLVSKEDGYKLSMRDMGEVKKLVNAVYPTVNGGVIKDILMSRI